MDNAFFAFLAKEDVEYKRNISFKELSSLKIGGNISCVILPDTIDKLIISIYYLQKENIKWRIVGRLTNLLPSDEPYCGAVISTKRLDRVEIDGQLALCECGVLFSAFLMKCSAIGLLGDIELFGIPGSVGGMLYSNAGAYGKEISSSLSLVRVFSPYENRAFTLDSEKLKMSYRTSIFKEEGLIALEAVFRFDKADKANILSSIGKIKEKRLASQPLNYPSLGSTFKRYNGVSAGYYIDKAGLKGLRIGGAMISDKHAGFILNTGNATAEDYRALIRIIKQRVYNKFKIILEEEIEYI